MGRNIKIELELPEFEKELIISVTLRKDGEVLNSSTSSFPTRDMNSEISNKPDPNISIYNHNNSSDLWKQKLNSNKSTPTSGNMMDAKF